MATFRYRGSAEPFAAETDVSGGVNPDGGETWTVTFKMRRDQVLAFIQKPALFIGSIWQPISLPSRNLPVICGWEPSFSGPLGSVELRYELKAGAAYTYSSSATDGSATEAAESTHDSVSHSTVERSLSECEPIFGSSDIYENAVVVEFCKKYIQAVDPLVPKEERDAALENFSTALTEYCGMDRSSFLASTSVKKVLYCLRNGQDSFLAHTSTATRTEVTNTKPSSIGAGVGEYSTPENTLVSGGTWLLVSDDVRQLQNGQYERVRTWQQAEIKSPTYSS